MSGNILLALNEVPFSKFSMKTSDYDITVQRTGKSTCQIKIVVEEKIFEFEDIVDEDGDVVINAEDEANSQVVNVGSSVFFPTFRRIEGGFTIGSRRTTLPGRQSPNFLVEHNIFGGTNKRTSEIEDALNNLSRRLTNSKHVFVSSISTSDIVQLLLTRYTELSSEYSALQQKTSEDVVTRIKAYQKTEKSIGAADAILDEVATQIVESEHRREAIMAPFEAVRKLVERLFRNYGINFGTRMSFGDAANAVNSDSLSAGEKQMLSFICYNAFYSNAAVLIDEPELSLHVDWQRQLFSILLSQQSSNQFIIATHSPFIYGKYPDKEVSIDLDRGDAENAE
ncbi:hypothetical protein A0U90_02775 [Kozakia baliensis]|nr:hypothetical protein A0U90_02775 [Kozakia baliensis]